jgi:hypothetical protein
MVIERAGRAQKHVAGWNHSAGGVASFIHGAFGSARQGMMTRMEEVGHHGRMAKKQHRVVAPLLKATICETMPPIYFPHGHEHTAFMGSVVARSVVILTSIIPIPCLAWFVILSYFFSTRPQTQVTLTLRPTDNGISRQ